MASTRNAAANELYLASLGGATEQIFTTRVLVCLDHKDLCSLSQCSRALLKAAFSTQLWSALLRKDFGSDEENISVQTFPQNFTPMSASTLNTGAKALYKQKFRDFQQKVQLKLNARIDYEATWSLNRRLNIVERCLDCTQVRLMIPLPFAALFSFCLLLTLYFDGANISVWACFAPLFYLFFYLMLCMIIARVVYKRQYSAGVLNGVWSNLRGPVRNFFSDVLGDNAWLAYFTTFIIFLAAAAVILVAVKLASLESGTSLASSSFATISWGLVFLPIWCLFCAFCVSPVIGFFKDLALFFISLALLWVPFFILAVCLAVKLDGEQYHKKTANIKMSLIFMPFWIMEGAVMLGTLSFLAIGIYRCVLSFSI